MATFNGLAVVSSARKVIARVPSTDRIVEFPQDSTVSDYGKGNTNPAVVVQNKTDGGSWQGANPGHFIIVNEVPEEAALRALSLLGDGDYTIDDLDAFIASLASDGCTDQYTTDSEFVNNQLSPAGKMVGEAAGIVKRDSRDVCTLFRDADGVLQVVVKDEPRRIEDDIALRTYVQLDGSPIDLSKVPTVN